MHASHLHDTSGELLIQRVGSGIRLTRPDKTLPTQANQHSVCAMFAMPLSVYFKSAEQLSVNINVNAFKINTIGGGSKKALVGKTAYDYLTKEAAMPLIQHDQAVLSRKTMVIRDNYLQPQKDGAVVQTIAIKFPWLGLNNEIIGIFGCSIVLQANEHYSPANAFAALTQIGLLNPPNKQTLSPQFSIPHFTKREKDVLQQLSLGKSTKAIAQRLELSPKTVEEHLQNLKQKIGVYSRDALVEKTIQLANAQLIPPSNPLY